MEPLTVNSLISDHIMKALCNTLMHSLWQGIVLAAVSGAIVIFTKKAKAAYRYNLLVGALALFALGVTVTFMMQLQKPADNGINQFAYITKANAQGIHVNTINPTGEVPGAVMAPNAGAKQPGMFNMLQTAVNYVNAHYAIIVLIWFLIICAKSIQMAVGLHTVFHLRRTKVFAAGKDWERRLLQLTEQLCIKQTIRLLESGIAKVPMVIGHLKPVILIPVGLINSLSADEVEAILIHELAHIRRRDYLVNLLQSFMEIVFFFNPAVLWISQLIKTERENCCDDLAIAQSRNKENYIRALLSCEEYKAAGPNYAMALPGSKNSLLDRVKRMVGNRNHSLNLFEKTMLAVCLVVLGLGVSAFTARKDIQKAVKSIVASIHHKTNTQNIGAIKNYTPNKGQAAAGLLGRLQMRSHDTTKVAGNAPLVALVPQVAMVPEVDSLKNNNGRAPIFSRVQPAPIAGFAGPDTTNFKKLHAIGLELYHERMVVDTDHLSISLNDHELIVNGVRMPEQVFEKISRQFGNMGRYGDEYAQPYGAQQPGSNYANRPDMSKEIAWELIKENLVKDKTYFSYKLSRDEFSIDGVEQPDVLRQRIVNGFFKPDDDFNIHYTFKDPGIYGGSNSAYNKSATGYNNSSTDYQRQSDARKRYWAGQQRKIIDEMQREGLISNRKDLSFTLTPKTFVIDGLVQSNEVFERYRQEYVPADAGDNWNWNYSAGASEPTDAYRPRDWDASARQSAAERQRLEAERDKKLVADLMQDGLITNPNNVTFTLNNKGVTINGKKQSDDIYQKYKEKYMPNDSGGDWSWTYQHHE